MTPRIVTAARAYLGAPWRHLGRGDRGVDCIGLVLLAAARIGVQIPDPAPYDRAPQNSRLFDGIATHADRVAAPEPGDVLLFRMGLYGGHVGIASMHPAYRTLAVIHAYAPRRHVVEQPFDHEIKAAFVAAFRLPQGA